MKENDLPQSEFEKLVQQQMQQLDPKPDGDTWSGIAARQKALNPWLRLRYYSLYAVPVAATLVLALAAWWYMSTSGSALPSGNNPAMVAAPAVQEIGPEGVRLEPAPADADAPEVTAAPQGPSAKRVANAVAWGERPWMSAQNTVPATVVRFLAEKGVEYENPESGNRVRIPAGALIHPDGRPVHGEVALTFREYRSIPEFLASGIPMHYADQRGDYCFNSGGMFEVRVQQQGETLQMAPGQTYDMVFTPTTELTKASLFYLDDASGAWAYQRSAAFYASEAPLPAAAPVVSEAEAVQNNKARTNVDCLPEYPELPSKSDPVEWLQLGVQTGFDLAAGKMKMPMWFRKNPGMNNEQLLNGLERGQIRIVHDRDRKEQFFPEDITGFFTELKAFKDCYFIRTPDSTKSERALSALLEEGKDWQRIAVYKEIGNTCHIILYSEQGLTEFNATLTASPGKKSFDVDKVLAEYRRLRTERQNNFEALVTKLRRFLLIAPAFQQQDEWCMAGAQWLAYFEENHPQMLQRYEALIKAGMTSDDSLALSTWKNWRARLRQLHFDRAERNRVRMKGRTMLEYALKLTSFGIYNCDQIFRLNVPESDFIFAAYKTTDGRQVVPYAASVMDRQSRVYFSLPNAGRMVRASGRRLDIVVTDREGRSYHLPADRYLRAVEGLNPGAQSNTFVLDDITDKTRSPREWAEYLDM